MVDMHYAVCTSAIAYSCFTAARTASRQAIAASTTQLPLHLLFLFLTKPSPWAEVSPYIFWEIILSNLGQFLLGYSS
jgi:hypothetical protein